jgi:uncharacterized protein (TIGR03437 family)
MYGSELGTDLAQLRVLFETESAQVLSLASGQLNAVVPFGVAGKPTVPLVIEYAGQRSTPVAVPVARVSPGLFTADSSGRGQAAAQNENGSANNSGNPAARGAVIVLYGTGQGQLDAEGRPSLPVTVQIGGVPAEIVYAGPVTGIPGLLQVNARIGQNASTGAAVPVILTIDGINSASDVTVAVQ